MDTKLNEMNGLPATSDKYGIASGSSIHSEGKPVRGNPIGNTSLKSTGSKMSTVDSHVDSGNRTGSTYRATIRTPMSGGMAAGTMSSGTDASLTGLEDGETDPAGRLTNLSHRAKELAGTTRESLSQVKDSLMNRASNLSDQICDITGSTKDSIVNRTHMVTSKVKSLDYGHMVDDSRAVLIRDPSRTMLIAGGIGLALGFLLGRDRR